MSVAVSRMSSSRSILRLWRYYWRGARIFFGKFFCARPSPLSYTSHRLYLSRRDCHSGWPSSELLRLCSIVQRYFADSRVATSSSCLGREKWYVPRLPPRRLRLRLTEFPHNSASQNGSLHSLPKTRPRSSRMSLNSSYRGEHACATFSNTKANSFLLLSFRPLANLEPRSRHKSRLSSLRFSFLHRRLLLDR